MFALLLSLSPAVALGQVTATDPEFRLGFFDGGTLADSDFDGDTRITVRRGLAVDAVPGLGLELFRRYEENGTNITALSVRARGGQTATVVVSGSSTDPAGTPGAFPATLMAPRAQTSCRLRATASGGAASVTVVNAASPPAGVFDSSDTQQVFEVSCVLPSALATVTVPAAAGVAEEFAFVVSSVNTPTPRYEFGGSSPTVVSISSLQPSQVGQATVVVGPTEDGIAAGSAALTAPSAGGNDRHFVGASVTPTLTLGFEYRFFESAGVPTFGASVSIPYIVTPPSGPAVPGVLSDPSATCTAASLRANARAVSCELALEAVTLAEAGEHVISVPGIAVGAEGFTALVNGIAHAVPVAVPAQRLALVAEADTAPRFAGDVPATVTHRANRPLDWQFPSHSGGNPPLVTMGAIEGTPPVGLRLPPDGSITGTPLAEGTFVYVASVTDSDGDTARVSVTFEIQPDVPSAVSVGDAAGSEGDTVSVPLAVSPLTETPLVVRYTLGTVSADDSAETGDYRDADGGSVTIPAGSDSGTIRVSLRTDRRFEPDQEVFALTLDAPGVGETWVLGSRTVGLVTLRDDPTPPPRLIVAAYEGRPHPLTEARGPAQSTRVTVALDSAGSTYDDPVTMSITLGGDAVVESDYTTAPRQNPRAVFLPGATLASIGTTTNLLINITDDAAPEADEEIHISVASLPGHSSNPMNRASATQVIRDNDGGGNMVSLSVTPATITEGTDGQVDFRVTAQLDGTFTEATTVYVFAADHVPDSVDLDDDINIDPRLLLSLVIPADTADAAVSGTFSEFLRSDNVVEPTERLHLVGERVSVLTLLPSPVYGETFVTVLDDQGDRATVSIRSPSAPVAEGGSAQFRVTMDRDVAVTVAVPWRLGGSSVADGDDVGSTVGSVTIDPGDRSASFSIPVTDDTVPEGAENLVVALGDPTTPDAPELASRVVVTTGTQAAGVISASDPTVEIGFDPVRATVSEGPGSTQRVVVTLDAVPERPVTVPVVVARLPAASGADFTLPTPSEVVFGSGDRSAHLDVGITDDDNYAGAPKVAVLGFGTLPAGVVTADASKEFTLEITENDEVPDPTAPSVPRALSVDPAPGDDGRFTLTVSWIPPEMSGGTDITHYEVEYWKTSEGMAASTVATITGATPAGTDTSLVLTDLDPGTEYSARVRARGTGDDPSTLYSAHTPAAAGSTGANRPPIFSSTGESVTVGEDASGVLLTVTPARDPEMDSVTHSIKDSPGLFTIDPATGALGVATGQTLDFETAQRHDLVVLADDSHGGVAELPVTVSVSNVIELPPAPANPGVTRLTRTSVRISWERPTNTGSPPITMYTVRYRVLVGGVALGEQTASAAADQTSLDIGGLVPMGSYEFSVESRNSDGASAPAPAGSVSDESVAPPVFASPPAMLTVPENSPAGTAVGAPIAATDPDYAGDMLVHELLDGDAPSGEFVIGSALGGTDFGQVPAGVAVGQIRVAPGAALDYEGTRSYNLTVRATDFSGATVTHEVRIDLEDVRLPAPTGASASAVSDTRLDVSWTAPVTDFEITDYLVRYTAPGSAPATETAAGTETGVALTGLRATTRYAIDVIARGPEGDSDPAMTTGTTGGVLTFGLDRRSVSVAEDAGPARVRVTVSGGTPAADVSLTVEIGPASGTGINPAEPADYTVPTAIVFPMGMNSHDIEVPITDDNLSEVEEVFVVTLSGADIVAGSGDRATVGSDDETSVTIGESDPIGFTFTGGPDSLDENDETRVSYSLSLTGGEIGSGRSMELTLAFGGSASQGVDYEAPQFRRRTFTQTRRSWSFGITPIDDALVEGPETFFFTLDNLAPTDGNPIFDEFNLDLSGPLRTVTIQDDDVLRVSFGDFPGGAVEEGSAPLLIPVTLDSPAVRELTVSATADPQFADDFTLSPAVFAQGATEASITAIVLYDGQGETGEMLDISLVQSGLPKIVAPASGADANIRLVRPITDSTTPPSTEVTLDANPGTLSESATSTAVSVTASLDGPTRPPRDVIVTLTRMGSDPAGSRVHNVSLPNVTIPAGYLAGTVAASVDPVDDDIATGDTDIAINGSGRIDFNDGQPLQALTVDPAMVRVTEDDIPAVSISAVTATVGEADGSAALDIEISRAVPVAVVVRYATRDGTATAGEDYTAETDSVTFEPDDTTPKRVTVPISDDMVSEAEEIFNVSITNVEATGYEGTIQTAVANAAVAIGANDPLDLVITGPVLVTQGELASYMVSFGNTNRPAGALTVPMSVEGAAGDSLPAAVEGTHFDDPDDTLTIGENADSATFTVQTRANGTDDPGVGWRMVVGFGTLPDAGGGFTEGSAGRSVATAIRDDVVGLEISFGMPAHTVSEGGSTVVSLVASETPGSAITVPVTVVDADTDAVSPGDYTRTPAEVMVTATSHASQTFAVSIEDDTLSEAAETLVLGIDSSGFPSSVSLGLPATVRIDIPANDGIEFSLSGPTGDVTEGDTATHTITETGGTRTVAVDAIVLVDQELPADPAQCSALPHRVVTLPADSRAHTFDVNVAPDMVDEDGRMLTVAICSVSAAEGNLSIAADGRSATTPVMDNESAPTHINLVVDDMSVDEDEGTVTIPVRAEFAGGVGRTGAVAVSLMVGTATANNATPGVDYGLDATLPELTIPARAVSSPSADIALSVTDDITVELNQTIVVTAVVEGLAVNEATIEIADDDTAMVSISAPPRVGIDENAESPAVTFTVTLSNPVAGDVEVSLDDEESSARSPEDYAGPPRDAAVTFSNVTTANATRTFEVAVVDDNLAEARETFVLSIAAVRAPPGLGARVTRGADFEAVGRIEANDQATLSISGPGAGDVDENAASPVAVFTVTLSNPVDQSNLQGSAKSDPIVVSVATSGGSATEGADYVAAAAGASVTFADVTTAGATREFTVALVDDDLSEGDETFALSVVSVTPDLGVRLSNPAGTEAEATIPMNDPVIVSLSGPPGGSVAESGGNAVHVVSLLGGTPSGSVDIAITYGGTAVRGTDFTGPDMVSIPLGETSANVPLAIIDNTVDEGDRTIEIGIQASGAAPGGIEHVPASREVSTTITDDDTASGIVSLSVDDTDADENEGDFDVLVTATLDGMVSRSEDLRVNVAIGTADTNNATQGTGPPNPTGDYHVSSPLVEVVIPARSLSGTAIAAATLAINDDDIVEGTETVVITGTATDHEVSAAEIAIADNDTAVVSISGPAEDIDENAAAPRAVFTVTLTNPVEGSVEVSLTTSDGSATAGADYTAPAAGAAVTFSNVTTVDATRTFAVDVLPDNLSEGDETFNLRVVSVTPDFDGQLTVPADTDEAGATISMNDPVTVSLTGPGGGSVLESVGNAVHVVSLSGGTPSGDVDIAITYDGTATRVTDFTGPDMASIPLGQTSVDVSVAIVDDDVDDDDETVGFTILASGGSPGGFVYVPASRRVSTTITDNDTASGRVSLGVVGDASAEEAAGDFDVLVSATLEGLVTRAEDLTVNVAIGTATANNATLGTGPPNATGDYHVPATATLVEVVIPAGSLSGTAPAAATLVINDDGIVEVAETVVITGTATGHDVSVAEIVIADNDTASVSIGGPAEDIDEDAASPVAVFTVTLSSPLEGSVEVSLATSDGSATAGDDYAAPAAGAAVTFSGVTTADATQTFTVDVLPDNLSEGDETFTLSVVSVSPDFGGRISVPADTETDATISANDPVTVSLTGPAGGSVLESIGNAVHAISLSGGTPSGSVDIAITYDGTATRGADFTGPDGVTIASGDSTADVAVAIIDDDIDDDDETVGFTVLASGGSPGGFEYLPASRRVSTTITDNDAGSGVVSLSVGDARAGEDEGDFDVLVSATLDGLVTRTEDLTVTVSFGTAAADGATQGTGPPNPTGDYHVPATATLVDVVIPAGSLSGTATATATLSIIDDVVVEVAETVVITGTATGHDVSVAEIEIADNDTASVSIGGPVANIDENTASPAAVFTVTLSNPVEGSVEVSVATSDGGATAGDDYTAPAAGSSVTFSNVTTANATREFTVDVLPDNLSEGDETFTLSVVSVSPDFGGRISVPADTEAGATISANDPVTVSLTGPAGGSVLESVGNAVHVISLLGGTPSGSVDIAITYDGTATRGTDYTGPDEVTIASGSTSADVAVAIVDDTVDDDNETVGFTILASGGSPGGFEHLPASRRVSTTITDNDAGSGVVGLAVGDASADEDEGDFDVLVSAALEGSVTRAEDLTVTVDFGTAAANNATQGTGPPNPTGDYHVPAIATLVDVVIPAGSLSGTATATATLSIIDDGIVEAAETVVITGTATGHDVSVAEIEIADNDTASVSIGGPAANVDEEATSPGAVFTVTLSDPVEGSVEVSLATSDGGATAGADYTAPAAGAEVTFTSGTTANATQEFTVGVLADNLSEGDETFTLSVVSVSPDLGGRVSVPADTEAAATIGASDPLTVSLEGPATARENSTASYRVTVTGGTSSAPVTVSVAVASDSADASDYTAPPASLEIPAGEAGADFGIPLLVNADTGAETITVSVTGATGGGGDISVHAADSAVETEILEPGTISFVSASVSVAESAAAGATVSLTSDISVSGPVTLARVSGTATDGTDYTAVPPSLELTFAAPGGTVASLVVNPVDDSLDEGGGEQVVFAIDAATLPPGFVPGTPASVTVEIGDDDAVQVTLTSGTTTLIEGAQNVAISVTASLSSGTAGGAGLTVTLEIGTATGAGATQGEDYAVVGTLGALTIPAGMSEVSGRVNLFLHRDSVVEGDETLVLAGTAGTVTVFPAEIVIEDNDTTTVSIGGPAAEVDEDAASPRAVFTVTLSDPTERDLTVSLVASNGSATAGEDYTAPAAGAAVTFSGVTSANATLEFTVDVLPDAFAERSETFTLSVSSAMPLFGGRVAVPIATEAEATIGASDPIVVSLEGPATAREGTTASYRVVLAGGTSSTPVTVSVTVASDSADASDYTAPSASLEIPARETMADFDIPLLVNTDAGAETLTVSVTGATGGGGEISVHATDGAVETGILEPGTVSFVSASVSVDESAAAGVAVSLTSDVSVSVPVTLARISGTAAGGTDYTVVPPSLVVDFAPPAGTAASLVVSPVGDFEDEGAGEQVVFGIDAASLPPGFVVGTPASVTVTITDDDDVAAQVVLTADPVSVDEDAGSATVTVTAELPAGMTAGASGLPVALAIGATADGGATQGEDYSVVGDLGTLTVPAGMSSVSGNVTLSVTDDTVVEAAETVVLTGTATGFAVVPGEVAIADDDTARVSLSGPATAVAEDAGSAVFTATLAGAADSEVTVTLGTEDGTATGGADFVAVTGTVTFAAGATDATAAFTVDVTDDDLFEAEEAFGVTVATDGIDPDYGGAITPVGPASVAIAPDDADRPTVGISSLSADVTEGDSITVMLSLSGGVATEEITIGIVYGEPMTAHSASAEDGDFNAVPIETAIAPPARETAFRVRTNADSVADAGEVVAISVGTLSGGAPGDSAPARADPAFVAVTIIEPNTAPTFTAASVTREVAEGTSENGSVGAPVVATDDNTGDTPTYRLVDDPAMAGEDSDAFGIDMATGQITVAAGTVLDFEAKDTYTVTVEALDGRDARGIADTAADATVTVTIRVTDQDEVPVAPSALGGTALPIAEGGHTRLSVTWVAPVEPTGSTPPPVTGYEIQHRAEGTSPYTDFAHTGTGVETTVTGLAPDTPYDLRVRAVNVEGESVWATNLTPARTLPNSAPEFVSETVTLSVDRGAAVAGDPVGGIHPVNNEDGDALTYTLTGDDATLFAVDDATGQVSVGDGLDFDAVAEGTTLLLTLNARDPFGAADSLALEIGVVDESVDFRLLPRVDGPGNEDVPLNGDDALLIFYFTQFNALLSRGSNIGLSRIIVRGLVRDGSLSDDEADRIIAAASALGAPGAIPDSHPANLYRADPFVNHDALLLFYSIQFGGLLTRPALADLMEIVVDGVLPRGHGLDRDAMRALIQAGRDLANTL